MSTFTHVVSKVWSFLSSEEYNGIMYVKVIYFYSTFITHLHIKAIYWHLLFHEEPLH